MNVYTTTNDNMFIGKLNNKLKSTQFNTNNVLTIIILDVSGSMSSYVRKIITQYIPDTLVKMNYHPQNDQIRLITFSDLSKISTHTAHSLRGCAQGSEGSTHMKPAVDNLKQVIEKSHLKQFRIITISDGELHDQIDTINTATRLADEISGKYTIHSVAIRLFTSTQQPDTRGLASILQLNTVGESKLIDFKCPSIDEEFVNVFSCALHDTLGSTTKLISIDPIFKVDPWLPGKTEIVLSEGMNTFWIDSIDPTKESIVLKNEHTLEHIEINNIDQLDYNNFDLILKDKINNYIARLRLLKVVDMTESKQEVKLIVDYFYQLEKILFNRMDQGDGSINANDTSIGSRLQFLKKNAFRKSKSIVQELEVIANSERVSQLNSAQQADFLRNASTSANTINLAKRALKQGLDFDVTAVQEVREMKKHLDEILDIDDSEHTVSFYSQDTTLSGIKALCSMDDALLDNLTAIDILSLLNIVGTGTSMLVGDYPDPKTYHLTDLMPGVYISISDIITVRQQGRNLTSPYDGSKEITNAVPFYDDDRIQQFLMKYAPTLLEYTASLGMRNMIINIPNTYKYTVVGGVWLSCIEFQNKKTEINRWLFVRYVNTYKTTVGGQFDYVLDMVDPVKVDLKNTNSLYIGNNGVTNMIGPLIFLQTPEHVNKLESLPSIFRSLYTFEFYQVMKKFYRSDSDGYAKRKQMLDGLLGIDYTTHCTALPPLFETQKTPTHYSEYHVDQTMFTSITDRVYWIDYLSNLGQMFHCALDNDLKGSMESCDPKDERSICQNLGIDFPLKKFKMFCIYQGLMYDTLASRYDDVTDKMKILDPGNEDLMDREIKDYIKRQYHSHYQSELSKQNKLETEVLTQQLVDQMIQTDDIDTFIDLFKNGLVKNHVSVSITDVFKPGFTELKDQLFDPAKVCDLRGEKLRILILGCDTDENIVYNKGNTLRLSLNELERLMKQVDCEDVWTEIYDIYVKKNVHLYRGSDRPNRHEHNNDKPSYWAHGYKNLRDYFNNISKLEQDEYCKAHPRCCGVWDGVPVKWA